MTLNSHHMTAIFGHNKPRLKQKAPPPLLVLWFLFWSLHWDIFQRGWSPSSYQGLPITCKGWLGEDSVHERALRRTPQICNQYTPLQSTYTHMVKENGGIKERLSGAGIPLQYLFRSKRNISGELTMNTEFTPKKVNYWILDSQLLPGLHIALTGRINMTFTYQSCFWCSQCWLHLFKPGKPLSAPGEVFGNLTDMGLSLATNCDSFGGKVQTIIQHTDSLKQRWQFMVTLQLGVIGAQLS